jgi:LCP family protein required for cell wall assembly
MKTQNEPKNRKAVFIKVLLVTVGVGLAASATIIAIFVNAVKPPEIPSISGFTNATFTPSPIWVLNESEQSDDGDFNIMDSAFLPPESAEEDLLIGGGMTAPAGFTNEHRKEQFYTFLIIGLDEGINTDTIMVASYDGMNKEANIISIPRDSLVNVTRRVKKINAAYPAGTLHGGGREGGVAQLRREIMTIIGFVPDFYISIDLAAFVRIIDAVGGVEINVPFHMKYDDPHQGLHIDIREGVQQMDGKTALKFARYRLGNRGFRTISDYQRIENQQAVIKAVLSNLLKPANILKIPEFIGIFNDHIHSDLTAGNMVWFANQLNEIRGTDALSLYTMPTTGTSGLPMYYELLDGPAIVELVNRTVNPFTKDITLNDLDIIR